MRALLVLSALVGIALLCLACPPDDDDDFTPVMDDDTTPGDDDTTDDDTTDDDTVDDDTVDDDTGDDDTGDDDTADDDTTDDDTGDDDTMGDAVIFESVDGGQNDADLGAWLVYEGDGVYHYAAVKTYTVTVITTDLENRSEVRIADFADRPVLAIDGNGDLHLIYRTTADHALWYANNVGGRWVSSQVSDAINLGDFHHLIVDDAGKAHVSLYDIDNQHLMYATNASGAWTLTVVDDSGNVGQNSHLFIDNAGRLLIAYYDAENKDLKLATRDGGVWTTETIVSEGDTGLWPVVIDDLSGALHLFYSDETNASLIHAAQDGEGWVFETIYTNPYERVSAFINAILDPDGHFHISFAWSNNALYATDMSGQWELEESWADQYSPGLFALDEDGIPLLIHQYLRHYIKYHRKVGDEWVFGEIEDYCYRAGIESHIALDADNHAHVLYNKTVEYSELYYGVRNDGRWQLELIDEGSYVGYGINLTLDAQGHAHASSANGYGDDVVYLTNTSGAWAREVVYNGYGVDSGSAIAVDAAGVPHIVYFDNTHDEMIYATKKLFYWKLDTIAETSGNAEDAHLLIDDAGTAHAAFYNGPYLGFFHHFNDGSGWTTGWTDERVHSGRCSDMALDGDDHLHFIYNFDDAPIYSGLRWANDISGEWVSDTPLSDTPLETFNAMAVDSTGTVHVIYFDGIDLYHLLGTWDDWETRLLVSLDFQTIGTPWRNTSLAIDGNDRLHVLFHLNDTLWYLSVPADYDGPPIYGEPQ